MGQQEESDGFGSSLTAGDFNGDGLDDLAMAATGENESSGAVNVIYGSGAGLTSNGNQVWPKDSPGIYGGAVMWEGFGGNLAAGDVNGDGRDDLGVGSAYSVNVIYGAASGLTAGDQMWFQGNGIGGSPQVDDNFGVLST